jgi:hypothetical protein
MVYQDNVIITLNSANASLINSTMKSNVSFNFIGLLKEEDDIVRSYISIINAQFPMSFYVITNSNNKLCFSKTMPMQVIDLIVPNGNYNAYTLSAKLMSIFLTYGLIIVIAVSPQTGIMSFTQSNPLFTLYPYSINNMIFSSIAHVIGLAPNDFVAGLYFTAAYPVNLLGTKKINIKSTELAINSLSSKALAYNNVIATIPVDYPFFSMISYVNQNALNKNIIKTPTIDSIDLQLTDEHDILLDFNNLDWTITLCLSIEREEKVKDKTTLKDIVKHLVLTHTQNNMNIELLEEKSISQDEKDLELLQK